MRVNASRGWSFWLLALLLFAPVRAAWGIISPEAGAFFIQQYSPEQYKEHPQNWAAVQDQRGVMFFGNTNGILEYDSARWRTIALPNSSTVFSLATDDHGTVYVGGQGEFGYLMPDASGTLRYASLIKQVARADSRFSNVWNAFTTPSGIYFSSYQRLFRWSPAGGMKVWRPVSRFSEAFLVNGVVYVVDAERGLLRIIDDSLERVPGGEIFAFKTGNPPTAIVNFGGALLVATGNKFFVQEGRIFRRYASDADKLLDQSTVTSLHVLQDGDLAVGTSSRGVILLDTSGRLDSVIDKATGIQSNSVNSFYQDREGGLWLMLNRGLARVDVESPLTRFGDPEGIAEIVTAIARQAGHIYAGTMAGLYRLAPSEATRTSHFEPVGGFREQVIVLLPAFSGLLVGTQGGLYEVIGDRTQKILQTAIFDLAQSTHDPSLFYAAGRWGLFVLRFDGRQWKNTAEAPSGGPDFRSVVEDSDGKLWVTTRANILRLDLSSNPVTIERFSRSDGVPAGWKNAYRIEGSVVFATTKGILKFNPESRHFVPDTRFGKMFADGSHAVSNIQKASSGDVWITGEGYNGVLRRNRSGRYVWDQSVLARSRIKELYALHLDPDGVVWASGADGGLVRYNSADRNRRTVDFSALVESVNLLSNDSTLYGGAGPAPPSLRIPHKQNALSFDFAAPSFEDESRTEYQVRLRGLVNEWSPWSHEARKEYTNLSEKPYAFEVRARDLYGRISREGEFSFSVLPPWYRTWWAYTLFTLVAIGAMWLLIQWRLLALEQQNRKLEAIIEERTVEIRQQRDEIQEQEQETEALLLNILPSPIAHELRATGVVAPRAYDNVTVCFTDFVGFTLMSEKLSAPDLVADLHRYFTAFDEIIGRYKLEKLKTIGDSYMFVAGLPEPSTSHAVDAVMAALEIVDAVERMADGGPGWKIRVGLHSGTVVAGVVGRRKFAFDIWGETVNFASRFESSGRPNQVNLSARTHELVRDFIHCEARGPVRIKEGRCLEMYFARHVKGDLLESSSNGKPTLFHTLYEERFGKEPSVSASELDAMVAIQRRRSRRASIAPVGVKAELPADASCS